MALTILERPIGVVLGTCVDANINEDYNGFATVNKSTHGLSDNDWVYVSCDVESYNGFYQIDVINSGEFALRQYDGTYLPFVVNANITYCPGIQTHGFQCVHLPITYRISNNKYPVNSVDTARTITSLANNSGFAQVGLSGTLGTFEDLQFVKISGAPDSTLDGIYQVIDKLSTSSVILNIDYTTVTNATLLGATMQLYYGNYNVVVRVYAGINSSHEWASEKPYELAATLELIPDDNNEVFFSINEILKAYIKTENNLLLPSLPNNIDAWTNFYISTAEAYDTSNGYSVSTLETVFTSDQSTFEGTAVNAELEFKNIHSGHLSDYLMTNSAAKFLTLFTIPVIFSCGEDTPDCYQDISFINVYGDITITVKEQYYLNGSAGTLTETEITEDDGVVRLQLADSCTFDRVDISLFNIASLPALPTSWAQQAQGTRTWTIDADPSVVLLINTASYILYAPLNAIPGHSYSFDYNITNSGAPTAPIVYFGFLNASLNFAEFITNATPLVFTGAQTLSGTLSITAPEEGGAYFGIYVLNDDVDGTTLTVNSFSMDEEEIPLSETKQFDIDCGCSDQEIRLTWLNNLGGFDYWTFTAQTEHAIDITQSEETKKNIFPNWPKSFGDKADTIRKQTMRRSVIKKFITSQYLTQDQADAIAYIKSSILVQIINSRQDRRTVTVDTDSFVKYVDGDKLYTISFTITYTDGIPSQTV